MNPCPLPKLLEEIIEWFVSSEFPYGVHISWTDAQLQIILKYLSEVEVDSDFSSGMYRKLRLSGAWQHRFEPHTYGSTVQLVLSFFQDLGGLFEVPKLQQLPQRHRTLKKNQVVAGFITFLLQLLRPDPYFIPPYSLPVVADQAVKELRYLVTILGDTPFQATEHEQVQSILMEFEEVANQAGIVVHRLIFIPDVAVKAMNEALDALLDHIKLLKSNIIRFLDFLPDIVVNGGVDSLFIVDSFLHDLEDLMNRDDDSFIHEAKHLIKTLHEQLGLCQSLFKASEHKEELEKESMVEVVAMTYDAEYLINSFLVGDAPIWYVNVRLAHHINKLKLNATRLQEMNLDHGMRALKFAHGFSVHQSLLTNKDSLVDDIIVAFEQHEKEILDLLIRGATKIQRIFISGMPGIGKTTLAKRIYGHSWVSSHFDKISWCVVSQMYTRKNLLIDILSCIRNEHKKDIIKDWDEECLELGIYQSLKDRRYLIVMDDIWDLKVWEDLQFLPDDGNGSRILFTGRNKDAAPSSCILYELPFFTDVQSWELLEKKIFHNHSCPPSLFEIGKNIATKCYGLPLVIVVVAGILSTMDKEERTWENVGQSLDCYILFDQSNSIMQIFELSYRQLPQYLKPCFLYFGVFENAEIPVKMLTQLWLAEGFVLKEDNKRAECIANEYLMELIDKNLIIISKRRSYGGVKFCIIHDLLRDLCLRIAQKENFLKCIDYDCSIWTRRYHRFCIRAMEPLYPPSPPCFKLYDQRLHAWWRFCSSLESSLPIPNMKLARVLNCPHDIEPDLFGIEMLVHLRCLFARSVPKSLHKNVNLEFLIVHGQVVISPNILKMVTLKCIRSRWATFHGDCDISQTSKLEYLSELCIHQINDLKMLKSLYNLHTLKCGYSLLLLEKLACLDFHFLSQLESLRVSGLPLRLSPFTTIRLPSNIKKLTLRGFRFPGERIPIIGGFPYLEVLKLQYVAFRGGIWDPGEFKQLRILKLQCRDLVQWNVSSCQQFPKLQQLFLEHCSELTEIPSEIGEVITLQLIEVQGKCRESLVESAIRIQEEQLDIGNEELMVDIRRKYGSHHHRSRTQPQHTAQAPCFATYLHN